MVRVILTRNTNTFIDLAPRATIANRNSVDLFISYHLNSATNKNANGYEDYTYPTQNKATIAARNVYHSVIMPFLRANNVFNRGKKTANFAVLRLTNMAAILVELMFISNGGDLSKLKGQVFFEAQAQTHAEAIRSTMKAIGKPNGTLCLDAGHGGRDPGAVNGKETEAAYVLRFVLRIKEILEGTSPTTNKLTEKEVDEMAQLLGETAKKDMRKLLQHAFNTKVFNMNHVSKVDKMTRGEALDLIISYNARMIK